MKNSNKIRLCAFDFDGTLVDTMEGFADLAGDILHKAYAIPYEEARKSYLNTSGIPFFQQLDIIRPGGNKNKACADEFEERKLEGFFNTVPDPATIAALLSLRQAGFILAVSSNNFQTNLDSFVKKASLPLDLVLGFEEGGLEKGKPHFDKIMLLYKLQPQQILFCGDSLKDGERAQSCHIPFVGLTGIFTQEEFQKKFPGCKVVDNIPELAQQLLSDGTMS